MENRTLREHIDYLIQSTKELQLSPYSFNRYQKRYEEVFLYCTQNQLDTFQFQDAADFCALQCRGQKAFKVREITKISYTVASYFKTGNFSWKPIFPTHYPVSETYEELLEEFRLELLKDLRSGTVRVAMGTARQFLFFLEQTGVTCVVSVTTEDVLDFVRHMAPKRQASMSELLRTVRKFCGFLRSKNIVDLDAERFLMTAGRCRQKVLPCFTDDELKAIFSQIDCMSDKGRRDYAIFLLSLRIGLRASDIARLKLTDIHWKESTILVEQKKTGVALELPLPVDVGNAIVDYILHSRYQTDNPYLFLRLRNSPVMSPIGPTAFNSYLRGYMKKAGIVCVGWDGRSFHGLRRTAGTNMVKSGTPISIVAQILGHRSIESSKRYISLDAERLRECSLDLGVMHTRKEGLI